jgi:small subunit ribosomal protein S4
MRIINAKYRICVRTNENVWNTKNIYKLKKKKWKLFTKVKKQHKLIPIVNNSFFDLKPKSTKQLYKRRLLARQTLKSFYGGLTNKKLKNIFSLLKTKNSSNIIYRLIQSLETRLDITLYRLNIASTIFEAKQLIQHKKVCVNNIIQSSRNYQLKPGDCVSLRSQSLIETKPSIKLLPYFEINQKLNIFVFLRQPNLNEIYYPFKLQHDLIFEYLNKN